MGGPLVSPMNTDGILSLPFVTIAQRDSEGHKNGEGEKHIMISKGLPTLRLSKSGCVAMPRQHCLWEQKDVEKEGQHVVLMQFDMRLCGSING